jgi:Flp pilus assembly protein CpaB
MTTTASMPGTEGQAVTQIMLQDVLVLNVGTWPAAGAKESTSAANTVTFALTIQDALAVKAARELGAIDLVLRKAGDHKVVTTEPVTIQYLNRRFGFNLLPMPGR